MTVKGQVREMLEGSSKPEQLLARGSPVESPVKELWTYHGVVMSVKDKLLHKWVNADGKDLLFNKLLAKGARPGSIYEVRVVHVGDGLSMYPNPEYKSMVSDSEELARIQSNSKAYEIEARVIRKAKADMSRDAIREVLKPLRGEYQRRNNTGRLALLVIVMEEIR